MKKNGLRSVITAFIVCLGLTQCERSSVPLEQVSLAEPVNEVSIDDAIAVSSAFWKSSFNSKARLGSTVLLTPSTLVIKKVTSHLVKNDPIFHVVEYKEGGWAIISADRRVDPILAYSEKGSFPLSGMPRSVQMWVDGITNSITQIRKEVMKLKPSVDLAWKQYELKPLASKARSSAGIPETNGTQPLCDESTIQCPSDYISSVPALMTQYNWGQDKGYAYYSPDRYPLTSSCSDCGTKALTGCGPLAVATILFYHNKVNHYDKPSGYNFLTSAIGNSCANINPGEREIARLIRWAGDNTSTNYFEPNCNTATLDVTSTTIPFSRAGYTNDGDVVDFAGHEGDIRSDLDQGHPVILSGTTCGTCLNDYHIWICDGYTFARSYQAQCIGGPTGQATCVDTPYQNFHMVWGERGAYDGWFGLSGWSKGGSNYNTYLKAHIHITP